eukprot:TRINITY_DN1457_c0_g1_i1.p1 TRINITY_DN1457_c0_g1~~TRINITY_DN1457_c0_g1_i1.p1  ORF type:complete len:130 (+),score=3.22 TRINITY_DN1457_c0_g1_i1:94-483(+)
MSKLLSCAALILMLGILSYVTAQSPPTCASLHCSCVGSSGVCCGGNVTDADNTTMTYCNPYCLEEERTCCGCNPLSHGEWSCFGCKPGDECVQKPSDQPGQLLYSCVSSSPALVFSISTLAITLFVNAF